MTALPPRAPERPVPAVLAVVLRGADVLLVQRANPPDAGLWGFPGGKIDAGETLHAAALRELREETGVEAAAPRVLTAVDVLEHDATGALRWHFVLIAVRCTWVSGTPVAADDALDARWVPLESLGQPGLPLSRDVARIAREAAARA
ncbi:NUDIX domain-containing protein (plasmid) [Paroceanicella profunda]|uniref:NUDIX domain-containing protein n=1 Tax=Paroceanicella profunda TaxID=2579971 RepID=A0A5B8G6Z0_9RHOB|nr:NUDIX hydrolase [Paroceanicella profunda]QDL94933.1 NUDIX domain-containing protein [Paroceanicella profunda]